MSAGTIRAPSASPDLTFASASARVLTRIGSIDSNSWSAYLLTSTVSLPSWNLLWSGGISLTTATRGFVGPLPRESPTATPRASEYATRTTSSSGARRRICRSLAASQRIALVAPLVQEGDEGGLEVALIADERGRRAVVEQLAVGEHQDAIGVALGLA